ncbi:MAG: S8 family serine peptidase [Polaribacter sp.]|nr:S8 family serine peptidase [Polaribacter sp.]
MKRNIYLLAILIFFVNSMMAQSNYYYYKGNKVNLSVDYNLSNQSGKLSIKRQNNIESITISNIFYVKLKNSTDLNLLQQVANQKNVNIIHQNIFMPLWYKLELNNGNSRSSLEICNEFYETGHFADIDPAFQFDFSNSCSNDDDFGDLWGLNNTTNPDIDINICNAWSITEGNGVNVAVLDQGIHKTHNDLNDNISSLSYDTQNGRSPSIFISGSSHGTHVAGIIGAEKDNNLQVVGVAPKSKIMSISNPLYVTQSISEELANGINWAVQNGAHIINNSWGDQGGSYYNDLHSAVLEDAITNALNNGRNGLGTILVFASGNRAPAIDYPASFHDDALVVGAISSSGNRTNFSGYGNDLDIVAPGKGILSTIQNQGIASLSGTSMAAPHVAGVAALILSVNPNLNVQEVNTIIEETAQKVGDYSYTNTVNKPNGDWNEQMGYGLVNAYQAVLLAQSYNCSDNLSITQNVNSGQTDNQQANYNIEAYNTIFSGGNANYNAGSSVILKPGFHARSEANFRAFIQNCEVSGGTDSFASKKIIKISENSESENEELESIIIDRSSLLNIYPNPSNGLFNIQSSSKIISYTVKNSFGKQIMFKKSNNQKVNIDISRFPVGLYFLSLQIENGELITKKILKK